MNDLDTLISIRCERTSVKRKASSHVSDQMADGVSLLVHLVKVRESLASRLCSLLKRITEPSLLSLSMRETSLFDVALSMFGEEIQWRHPLPSERVTSICRRVSAVALDRLVGRRRSSFRCCSKVMRNSRSDAKRETIVVSSETNSSARSTSTRMTMTTTMTTIGAMNHARSQPGSVRQRSMHWSFEVSTVDMMF